MKNIIDLYEASLLGDLEDTINSGDKEVDKFTQFGKLFSFDQIQFASDSTAVFFNAPTLKKLTKGMDYINSKINLGWFDSKNKIKMFINWLDHVSFEDLAIDYYQRDIKDAYDPENVIKKLLK